MCLKFYELVYTATRYAEKPFSSTYRTSCSKICKAFNGLVVWKASIPRRVISREAHALDLSHTLYVRPARLLMVLYLEKMVCIVAQQASKAF